MITYLVLSLVCATIGFVFGYAFTKKSPPEPWTGLRLQETDTTSIEHSLVLEKSEEGINEQCKSLFVACMKEPKKKHLLLNEMLLNEKLTVTEKVALLLGLGRISAIQEWTISEFTDKRKTLGLNYIQNGIPGLAASMMVKDMRDMLFAKNGINLNDLMDNEHKPEPVEPEPVKKRREKGGREKGRDQS